MDFKLKIGIAILVFLISPYIIAETTSHGSKNRDEVISIAEFCSCIENDE